MPYQTLRWFAALPCCLMLLGTLMTTRADADVAAAPTPLPSASPGGHAYDPCQVLSQQDVASAAGVAVDQVYTPQSPSENECMWAVANKAGQPAQQIALTIQTVNQVKQAHGLAKFGAILNAVQNIPGVPLPQDSVVQHAFADAQIVVGLGDQASWKNGTLSVVKNELLLQVNATGQDSDSESLAIAKSVAKSVLTHVNPVQPARP